MGDDYISAGNAATILRKSRRYVGELQRAGELKSICSGSQRRFLASQVHMIGEIINNSIDLVTFVNQYGIREQYRRFSQDTVIRQCFRKVGDDYFVRNELVDTVLNRLKVLNSGESRHRNSTEQ